MENKTEAATETDPWAPICPGEEALTLEGLDPTQIPEDFYVTRDYLKDLTPAHPETFRTAPQTRTQEKEPKLPLYNYVAWRGTYWDETAENPEGRPTERPDGMTDEAWEALGYGAEKTLPAGNYLIALEYLEGSSLAGYENTRFLVIEVVDNVGHGGHENTQLTKLLDLRRLNKFSRGALCKEFWNSYLTGIFTPASRLR